MFVLPELPYAYNALEPYIDEQTMQIHHSKHHQAYVDNLNKALEGQDELLAMDINELMGQTDKVPEGKRQAVINNGGGHANHTFWWTILKPQVPRKNSGEFSHKKLDNFSGQAGQAGQASPNVPSGKLAEVISNTFGSFETFKEKFSEKAMTVFGSGWAFLVLDNKGKLILKRHSFQNSPLMHGSTPILGLDVWEHAYYLKYQNRRKEYVEAWWNVVNWEEAGRRFEGEEK